MIFFVRNYTDYVYKQLDEWIGYKKEKKKGLDNWTYQ